MSVSLIASLIRNRELCRDCVADKTGLQPLAVEQAINSLAYSTRLEYLLSGICVQCRKRTEVYVIDRPRRR